MSSRYNRSSERSYKLKLKSSRAGWIWKMSSSPEPCCTCWCCCSWAAARCRSNNPGRPRTSWRWRCSSWCPGPPASARTGSTRSRRPWRRSGSRGGTAAGRGWPGPPRPRWCCRTRPSRRSPAGSGWRWAWCCRGCRSPYRPETDEVMKHSWNKEVERVWTHTAAGSKFHFLVLVSLN